MFWDNHICLHDYMIWMWQIREKQDQERLEPEELENRPPELSKASGKIHASLCWGYHLMRHPLSLVGWMWQVNINCSQHISPFSKYLLRAYSVTITACRWNNWSLHHWLGQTVAMPASEAYDPCSYTGPRLKSTVPMV